MGKKKKQAPGHSKKDEKQGKKVLIGLSIAAIILMVLLLSMGKILG